MIQTYAQFLVCKFSQMLLLSTQLGILVNGKNYLYVGLHTTDRNKTFNMEAFKKPRTPRIYYEHV